MKSFEPLLNELRYQRSELDVVIRCLERFSESRTSRRRQRKRTAGHESGHGMAADTKARISRAMKRRWAAKKKAAKHR